MLIAGAEIAVIGGGPGGLMAAEVLARGGARVTVYERMPSVGRKLLLAGRSGLNLTHAEPLDGLLARYGAGRLRLEPTIRAFPPDALRRWCEELGQPTFVGSTGRIFPEAFRATPLLRAWLSRLIDLGVTFAVRHEWQGWTDDGALRFKRPALDDRTRSEEVTIRPAASVLALGGASWPRVGSDGRWVRAIAAQDIGLTPFRPANCGFHVEWSDLFRTRFAGVPLKNIRVAVEHSSGGMGHGPGVRGEAVVTRTGIEGGVIYVVSAEARDIIDRAGGAMLMIDLHPDRTVVDLTARLARRRPGDSMSSHLRRSTGLAAVAVALLREVPGPAPDDPETLARLIKQVPVRLTAPSSIERAISTAGGIRLDEIDERWMLRRRPGVFVAGEMLDWEAPTGGYLLQATFSTAVAAGTSALDYVSLSRS